MSSIKDFEALNKCYRVTTSNRDHARECCLKLDQENKEAYEEGERQKLLKKVQNFQEEERERERQINAYTEAMKLSGRDAYGFALGSQPSQTEHHDEEEADGPQEEENEEANFIHQCYEITHWNRAYARQCCLDLDQQKKEELRVKQRIVNVNSLRFRAKTTDLQKRLFKEQLGSRMARIRLNNMAEAERNEKYGILV